MRITNWIAALALLGLAACAPATSTATSWPEFRVPGADFAVSMPAKPEAGRNTTAKDGSVSRMYYVDEGTIVYSVAYNASQTKTATALDGWLDNMRNELVTKMGGKLRNERRFSLGDSRAMELVLDVPKSGEKGTYTMRGRYYVKQTGTGKELKDVLYQTLVVIGDPRREADLSVAKFLDSFRFVGG